MPKVKRIVVEECGFFMTAKWLLATKYDQRGWKYHLAKLTH